MKAVNLIPSEQRAGGGPVTGESDGGAFLILGLLAGLAVLAGLYGIAAHQVSSRKSRVAEVTAQAQVAQARAGELAPYVSFKGMYQQRLQTVSELVNTRFDWAHAFHELGRVLPKDASLTSVHGTVGSSTGSPGAAPAAATPATTATAAKGATAGSATPPGSVPTFTLAGCATSQSEVAQTLQRLRLIDGVSSVTLQSSTKASTGGSSSGGAGCPKGAPSFAMQVLFAGLPSPPASSSTPPGGSTQTAASAGTTPARTASGTATTPSAATPVSNARGAQ